MAKLVIPNIFTPGTPAQASQMNANFEAISNWSASGQIDTDSIKIPLVARSNDNQGQPQPILRFVQTIDQPIMELQNAEGEASIKITQSEELDAGVGIIHIIDDIAQTQANSAAIKLALSDNATMPAISINHDAIQTLSLTKSEFRLIDSTFKVNATQMLIPRVTTGNRPAAAEEGSVLYNSTTKQLNEKRAASGGWAPVGAPVGSILMWPTATAPEGWVICNGDAVANGSGTIQGVTADFSALYAITGAALPDLRGRAVIGAGQGAGLTDRTLLATGGAETHLLTTDESGQKAFSGVTANNNFYQIPGDDGPNAPGSRAQGGSGAGGARDSGTHTHNFSIPGSSAAQAHNNMQPYFVLNYIIKY